LKSYAHCWNDSSKKILAATLCFGGDSDFHLRTKTEAFTNSDPLARRCLARANRYSSRATSDYGCRQERSIRSGFNPRRFCCIGRSGSSTDRKFFRRSFSGPSALCGGVDGYIPVDCWQAEVPAGICDELHSDSRAAEKRPSFVRYVRRSDLSATRFHRQAL